MKFTKKAFCILILLFPVAAVASDTTGEPSAQPILVGAAKRDITPSYPVFLAGFARRKTESEGVAQRLWAKALAIGGDEGDGPAVLIVVDNCGVYEQLVNELAARLKASKGIRRERLVVCSTHTHAAPWLTGFASWLYRKTLSAKEQDHRARYTRELVDHMEAVANSALEARKSAYLSWTRGKVEFAANRRLLKNGKWVGFGVQTGAPVDHDLPLLRVCDTDGKLTALVASYACHCTTFGPEVNRIHGDWAGCAQEYIEKVHPGAVAMIMIGCGGDAGPDPMGTIETAQRNGRLLADEVKRLLKGPFTPIDPMLTTKLTELRLQFDSPPSEEELVKLLAAWQPDGDPFEGLADYIRQVIQQVEQGTLPSALDYPIATWSFGNDLTIVFLADEVVVDYSLRLRRELDNSRLWITAYANDVSCYIPSSRILAEGGYEADISMQCYGHPARFSPQIENQIIAKVKELTPKELIVSP